MLIDYNKVLNEFEYDTEMGHWIRMADGKAFQIIEKDENDMAKIAEVSLED